MVFHYGINHRVRSYHSWIDESNVVLYEWRVHLYPSYHTCYLLLPLLCDPIWNSWSKSNRSSLRDNFISNSRSTSISIILLSFEQYSYTPNMEYSRTFSAVLGNFRKKRKKFLTNPIVLFTSDIICKVDWA